MTHHRLHALALACLLAMPASAFAAGVAPPTGISAGACVEGICEYRLRNGLRVLLFPDASKPTVTVNLTYLVGSVHENYGETGMAHLLEHLLFKGTPKHADIPGELKKRGVGFNASTCWIARITSAASRPTTPRSTTCSAWKPTACSIPSSPRRTWTAR
ncbi:MAG: insulinase family protein [Thermomonas sp.]|nr:insulinase family protein [Thermomonas sp.]